MESIGRHLILELWDCNDGLNSVETVSNVLREATIACGAQLLEEFIHPFAPQGITVNALAPGFIGDTPFHDAFTPASAHAGVVPGIPMGRAGTGQGVAGVAVFLGPNPPSTVTGQVTDINRGLNPR